MSPPVSTPRIIPVLDLRDGVVVHAVAGERDRYQPVCSRLVPGSRPLEVATALCDAVGSRTLYVADLDGLQRGQPDWATLTDLAEAGFELCVDAGVREATLALRLLDRGVRQVIAALETSKSPLQLAEILQAVTPSRLVFSLDLQAGRPLLCEAARRTTSSRAVPAVATHQRPESWSGAAPIELARTAVQIGVETILLLDLAGVGREQGLPTLALCGALRQEFPALRLWTGGGVRNDQDLSAAEQQGVNAVLVASALHAGRLLSHRDVLHARKAVAVPDGSNSRLRACELTPSGRGAVATLRLTGPLRLLDEPTPLFRAANGRPLTDQPLQRVAFGQWGREPPEDVVVCRIDPETAEVHCHGGRAAITRILNDVIASGGTVESPRVWLSRTASVVDAECTAALTQATTERTAALLAEQASGVLRTGLERLALTLSACGGSHPSAALCVEELLHWTRFGLHLTQPWSVVLCGLPNVGKSSLINAWAGFTRSIVSPRPGTTRDVVTTPIVLEGWPLELSDTAGLRATEDAIEAQGVSRAQQRIAQADLQLLLLDASSPLTPDDTQLLHSLPDALVIAHKSDLPRAWNGLRGRECVAVSSLTGAGLPDLTQQVLERLIPEQPRAGKPVVNSARIASTLERVRAAIHRGDSAAADVELAALLVCPGR